MLRVALGDAHDPRVVQAAATLARTGVVTPVLFQPDPALTLPVGVEKAGGTPGPDQLASLAQFVRDGSADAGVAGSLSNSPSVIRAGMRALGPADLVVGCFLMLYGGRQTTYADCSVLPDPTAEQLARIGELAADSHLRLTGEEPRVGMLSFSTAGSASHPAVTKVRTATEILRQRRPDLAIDGEVQFDVASDPEIARRKLPHSKVAGAANVMIFPSLDAGNIAYKLAVNVGQARALGSFVLNLSRPWVDLSRGCSVADIVDTTLLLVDPNDSAGRGLLHRPSREGATDVL